MAAPTGAYLVYHYARQCAASTGAVEEVFQVALPDRIGGKFSRQPVRIILGLLVGKFRLQIELRGIFVILGA